MSSHVTVRPGRASLWGPLWGARPDDWAANEDQQLPTYEAALERTWFGWRAVAALATLARPEREHELKNAIIDGVAPYRRPDGSYRLENEYHYLTACA